MEEKQSNANDPVSEWVTFYLAEEKYGINVMLVREVLKNTEIAPVPGSPRFVLGIINLRGNVVTVVDTRTRFGLPSKEEDDNSRIVVIEMGEHVLGMMVDSVAEVMTLRQSEIEFAPNVGNDDSAKYIQGVSNQENELVILVALDSLFTQDELLKGVSAH
ncbi:MAG: chemotaxis protein CheW [Chromatiales bacterium]|nr:chemotaxis protein CheW [Gammaproteobacteria bacterium]MBW6476299.1 chemotaxis protein CheW [Chromatiales bacterium]